MRIMITGVTGFIGSELARQIVKDDKNEVTCLVRVNSNSAMFEPIKPAPPVTSTFFFPAMLP